MKYLLDTHTFLWFVAGSSQMSERAIELIEKENNEIFFSFASVWEMSIKSSLGKLQLTLPFSDFIQQEIEESSIILLEIKLEHLNVVNTLAFYHRDPFDRLIIAQAMVERIPAIGRDLNFDQYPIKRIW